MDIHVCKQCGSHFVYCRACVFRPIRYKDMGFCSKECYEASKNVVVSNIEPEIIEEVVLIDEVKQVDDIVEEIKPVEEAISSEVIAEVIAPEETAIVAKPTIKKETYHTYKKKKK